MARVIGVFSALLLVFVLGFAVSGCSNGTATGDKMQETKMQGGKMKDDKMQGAKMSDDKMQDGKTKMKDDKMGDGKMKGETK
jgi:pentapeptide MXKDX repeat protein